MTNLMDNLPGSLNKRITQTVFPGETIEIQLKGSHKEALICTDRRVMIIKSGIMTGHFFGYNIFQATYTNISVVDVQFGMLVGYFQLGTSAMQSTPKAFMTTNSKDQPWNAPNCVSLNSRSQASRFREACSHILRKIDESHAPSAAAPTKSVDPTSDDASASVQRLWKLKVEGAISQEEFDLMKRDVLARL